MAVCAVVMFHAGATGFSWGFWGVDVFFVLSGYLITGIICRDIEAGIFSIAKFWARRVRRLVPAAGVTILVTLVACVFLGSPLEWAMVSSDAAFSALWGLNLSLGLRDVLYFDADAEVRPLLHFWSLALEEQFYLVWPVLLAGVSRVSRRAVVPLMAVVAGVSFAMSAQYSMTRPESAFFLLPFRAWELAIGALAASVVVENQGIRRACGWLGLAFAGVGISLLTNTTPVPGTLSALPVLATALWVVAGRCWVGGVLLATRPFVVLGGLSFGLYLWHWPVLVLGRPVLGDSVSATCMLLGLALALASLSYRLVEVPVRFHPRLVASVEASFAAGLVIIAVDLGAAGALRLAGRVGLSTPSMQALQAIRKDVVAFDSCDDDDGCEARPGVGQTVLVLGDSHAMQWVPAVVDAAAPGDWRVIYAGRSACPGLDVPTARPSRRDSVFEACKAFHARLDGIIQRTSPAAVVMANADGYLEEGAIVTAGVPAADVLAEANRSLVAHLRDRGVGVVVVLDHPLAFEDPVRCRARGEESCAPRVDVRREPWRTTLRAAAARAVIVDATALMCSDGVCPLVRGGVDVWRDRGHITGAFSRSQAGVFKAAIEQALTP